MVENKRKDGDFYNIIIFRFYTGDVMESVKESLGNNINIVKVGGVGNLLLVI